MNEFLASAMSFLAQLFDGSMGWAILVLALAVRLALLPLTLHLSRKMLANQQKIKALEPQVTAIRERLAAHPQEMFKAISVLYKENGAHLLDRSSLLGGLLQLPVFALLYQAISKASSGAGSFLWIRSLAAPDVLLTGLVLLLTAVSAWYFPSANGTAVWMVAVQVLVTAFVMWKLASGVGLYWAASAFVGALQALVLRIGQRRLAAHAVA
ncbi:membrane protein insertase YidC [Telluria aromaticivorans]|uniref:Membrane protein insertase YidC n=1 Tax=Telluria aromaticivorans TaxID=2725995 RepID=A0A7Y2JXI9_9BURK|nr:membrane protein insertase YidC [Telluria aromaticivorans]NNG22538.1 membrane protein insertase YidC [Telluria aromaticivorans]